MFLPHFSALGAGPLVLFLHGAGGGYRSFAPQVEYFARVGFRAVAWDMPGYGSSTPVEPYGVRGLAQSCVALIEALLPKDATGSARSVALVGHGLGGMVAQEVVMRRPELVNRLVLSGTTSQADAAWREDADAQLQQLESTAQGDMARLSETVVDSQVGPLALPEGVQLARHCMAQLSPVTYRLALQAQASFDREAVLSHIHVPTLLLTGENDLKSTVSTAQRMASQIEGSRWVQLPGIGHLQNLEAPDAFDALVLDFLREPHTSRLH